MLTVAEIELEIAKRLRAELPSTYCEVIPDTGATGVLEIAGLNEGGAIFVQYAGTTFGNFHSEIDETRFIIYVCSKDYNGEKTRRGVKHLLEQAKKVLKNWEYEQGNILELNSEEFNSELNGVWIYSINASTKRISFIT